MKEPLSNKNKPGAPRKDPGNPRSSRSLERQLKVRFYCSMRPQRVYPLIVQVQAPQGSQAAASAPVVLRPVIPGAMVTPSEQKVDVSVPGTSATFHVTPLACGRLPDARVEIHHQGQTPEQVRLRMKAKTQRRTWILLALTVLLPFLLFAISSNQFWKLRDPLPGKPPELMPDPGDVLEHRVNYWVKQGVPEIPYLREYLITPVTRGLNVAYTWFCNMAPDFPHFWVGVGLLALTLLSWIARRTQRSTRWKSLVLTAPVPLAEAAETLPLSAREAAPVVQPAD